MSRRRALRFLGAAHGGIVHGRRIRGLARALAPLLESDWHVLDVGCGDGQLGALIAEEKGGLRIEGMELDPRPETHIPVRAFDGRTLPLEDDAVDAVMLVDVLHHTDDARVLLREARRVARHAIVMKDHRTARPLAHLTLRFMDWVGNKPHGVALPYNYWSEAQWRQAWSELQLQVEAFETRLDLYPGPAKLLFENGLHFVARLALPPEESP